MVTLSSETAKASLGASLFLPSKRTLSSAVLFLSFKHHTVQPVTFTTFLCTTETEDTYWTHPKRATALTLSTRSTI